MDSNSQNYVFPKFVRIVTVTQSSIIVITVVERVRTLAETKIHVRSQTRSFQWDHVRELNFLMPRILFAA